MSPHLDSALPDERAASHDAESAWADPGADPAGAVAVLAKHGRSFSLASHFLPPDCRRDAALLYAFCRWIDDLADEATSEAEARRSLTRARRALLAGASDPPLLGAFLELCNRRSLDLGAATELIDGAMSDLGTVRFATDDELLRYAYRVAGTVGLMMCGVLGVDDPRALPHAIDLGVAMQLTNICRDVAEDARRGRIYLPAARLKRAGVRGEALLAGAWTGGEEAALAPVIADLLELADGYYRSGEAGMRYLPFRARIAIRVASRLYQGIGHRLRRDGCLPLRGRTVLDTPSRLRLLLSGLTRTLVGEGAWGPHDPSLHALLPGLPGTNASAGDRVGR